MKQSVIRTEKMNLKRKREAATATQLHILELQTALQGIVLRGTEPAAETLDTLLLLTVVEELKVHVAHTLIQNESERVVAVVTVEGVTRATGEPAVDSLADPAATVQMEHPVITQHTLAIDYTQQKIIHQPGKFQTQPTGKLHGYAIISTPGPLLAGNTSLTDYYQFGGKTVTLSETGIPVSDNMAGYTMFLNQHTSGNHKIFTRAFLAQPVIHMLAERPAHLGEVHPDIIAVTLERYHVTVNARELYQTVHIFHRTRNTKKEKPP